MRWKRLFYYLLINVLVSAGTVLAVLYFWERYRPQEAVGPVQVVLLPTATTGPAPAAPPVDGETAPVVVPEFINYTVLPGDTLSGIANQFGVTVEAILAVNNLANPDALDVGAVISIPSTSEIVEESTPEAAPSSTPPPVPTLDTSVTPGDFGDPVLQIVTVIGAGDLADERIVIRQEGEAQVSLQGWQIRAPGGQTYTFPQLVLFKDGAVTLYTNGGANSVAELHWGLDGAIWSSGDVVSLLDPDGNIVAAYQIP